MFNDAPDRDYTVAIATTVAELKRKSALAAGGLLPQYQSATTAFSSAPTLQELTDYAVIAGFRTAADGTQQPTLYDRIAGVWRDNGRALALQSSVAGAITPEQYGAVGDGVTDDKQAIWDMCAAYRAGAGSRMVFSRPYRIGRGTTAAHIAGSIEFIGLPRVHIEFVGKGEIIMDNLAPGGNGDQYSGMYIGGPADHVEIINPRIRWTSKPTSRSQGYGVCVRGYPDEANAAYIKRAIIRNPEVKWAPQGGVIVIGVSDPLVENPRLTETLADGMHFNACRRPRVVGPVQAYNIGDDALALVTYYGTSGLLVTTGTPNPNDPYLPYQLSSLGDWSNGGGIFDGVMKEGGLANACRINGGYNISINSIIAVGAPNGLIVDAAKRNVDGSGNLLPGIPVGTPPAFWNAAASRGIRIGSIIADNCGSAFSSGLSNISTATDPSDFYNFDVEIGAIQDKGSAGTYGVYISSSNGIKINTANTERAVLINGGAHGTRIDRLMAKSLTLDHTVDTTLGMLDVPTIILTGANDTRGNIWTSVLAPGDALSVLGDSNNLHLNQLNITYANRSATSYGRAVLIARGHDVQVARTTIVHDGGPLRSVEIGGGDSTGVSDRVDFGQVVFQHQQLSNTGSFSVQTGAYAARLIKWQLRSSNDNGASWIENTLNTYSNIRTVLSDADRVIHWGDSRTEGPDIYSTIDVQLAALISRPIVNQGISGQTSAQIAARSGTLPYSQIHPTSSLIPGDGTPSPLNVLTNADLLISGVTRTLSGTVAGNRVLLTRTIPGGGYDVRQFPATGTDATVSANADFIPDNLTLAYVHIFWMGRNDDLINGIAALRQNIANMVARVRYPKRYFVMGELNAMTEPNGNATCESIKTYNAQQLSVYGPTYFLDPRSVLCVQNDGVTASTDGTPNPLWMQNAIHPNDVGNQRLARALAVKFNANGW